MLVVLFLFVNNGGRKWMKNEKEKKERISGFDLVLIFVCTLVGVLIMYRFCLDYFEKENTEKKLGTTDRHLSKYSLGCT